jgi:uncharacterized protein (DUF1330 family)
MVAVSAIVCAALGIATVYAVRAQPKAPAYIFTEFEVLDQAALKEFSSKAAEVVRNSGAKYLVRRGQIIALEGEAPKLFTVQVFDSLESARAFRSSRAWQELTPLREKALKQRSFIAEGVAN